MGNKIWETRYGKGGEMGLAEVELPQRYSSAGVTMRTFEYASLFDPPWLIRLFIGFTTFHYETNSNFN